MTNRADILSWKNRLAYSSINFGFSLLAITIATLLMYYYTDVLLLPALAVSGILLVIRLFDGLVDPFLGYCMDRRTTRHGKYRGYILYWAAPLCLAFALMFFPVTFSETGRILWCLLLYAVFTLAYSVIEIASLPMLASFGDRKSRFTSNTWKMFSCVLASLLTSLCALKLVQILGKGSEPAGYFRMALLFAGFVLAALLIGGAKLKEGPYAVTSPIQPDRNFTCSQAVKTVLKEKSIFFLLCMCLCLDAARAFKMQGGIYYLKYNMGRQDLTTMFLASSMAASLAAQPLLFWLFKKIPLRSLMIWGCSLSAASFLLMGRPGNTIGLFMTGNCLYGMASAVPTNLAYSHMAELSERLSIRQKRPLGGLANSFIGLSSRIGSSCASALLTLILSVTGYLPNANQTSRALGGIKTGFIMLPVLTLVLGGFFAVLSFLSFDKNIPQERSSGFHSLEAKTEIFKA